MSEDKKENLPTPAVHFPAVFREELKWVARRRSDLQRKKKRPVDFENVGIYELIRRRCRFIVAIEAGADPKLHENVGRIVRQARMDFGVRIDIDTDLISPDEHGLSKQHLVVGRIHYGDVHAPAQEQELGDRSFKYDNNQGIIIWLKNSFTGDEPGDLQNHRAMHPEFPYDSTADQFFNASQFESYRELGLHAVQTMLTKSSAAPHEDAVADGTAVQSATATGYGTHQTDELACSFATPAAHKNTPQLHEFPTRELFEVLFRRWNAAEEAAPHNH